MTARKKKFNWVWVAGVVVVVAAIVAVCWCVILRETEPVFELSAEVYEQVGVKELTAEEYAAKLDAGESFLVLAHTVACPTGMPLTELAGEVAEKYQMTIYALTQEEFRQGSLGEKVKFLPSLVLIHDGQVVRWLDAESDADLAAYQSLEGLTDWLSKYVKL